MALKEGHDWSVDIILLLANLVPRRSLRFLDFDMKWYYDRLY